jgi:hypothetical protein
VVDSRKHSGIGDYDPARSIAHHGALSLIQYASSCERDELDTNSTGMRTRTILLVETSVKLVVVAAYVMVCMVEGRY